MGERLDAFHRFRTEMNEKILAHDNLVVRRFFNLDGQAYKPGALSSKVKEMLGLVASLVLRCDDCITYHMIQCHKEGVTRDEFFEIFGVALIVGGSITIPHVRRAVAVLEAVEGNRVVCRVEAYNDLEKIAEGRQVQVVLDRAAFRRRIAELQRRLGTGGTDGGAVRGPQATGG